MNTNPDAKIVLCFGDSNTWGQTPDKSRRYSVTERWTGRLQSLLGDDYYIIEEGLGGRNTDVDYFDGKTPGRNGRDYLQSCFPSHNPIDLTIIMLGTGDLKIAHDKSAEAVAESVRGLINDVKKFGEHLQSGKNKILVLSPLHINVPCTQYTKQSRSKLEGCVSSPSATIRTTCLVT